jgi:hypothetical protein
MGEVVRALTYAPRTLALADRLGLAAARAFRRNVSQSKLRAQDNPWERMALIHMVFTIWRRLGYLYGNAPELGRTAHVRHQRENSGPGDTRNNISYDRTSRIDFLWYLSENIWTVLGLAPYAYFKARADEKNRRRMLWGMARYYTYFAAVFIYDWRIGIMFVLVPLLCMNFINAITAWVQHAFCAPDNPLDYFANTVTVVDKVNFLNEGYTSAITTVPVFTGPRCRRISSEFETR